MHIKICFIVGFMLMALTGCGSAHKTVRPDQDQLKAIKTLAVLIDQDTEFEVVYSRATADGTGAVLFGVVGAAIGASIDEGEDREKAESMATAVEKIDFYSIFSDALTPLEKNGPFQEVTILDGSSSLKSLDSYDAVVTFTIDQWGLRLVEQKRDLVSGFVELEMKMKTYPDQKIIWDERHVVLGQGREYLRKYMSDSELLQNEMVQTIQATADRMSNLLIYQ